LPIRPRTPRRSAQSGLWRHWTLWAWFAVPVVLCAGGVALWKSGNWLVREDAFDRVRWGLVLAGESRDCERTDAAIRMFHAGKIDSLIISSTRIFKNRYQSEFMVDYYLQQGVPRDRLFEFRQDAYSTLEEARLLVRQFRLQNLDTVLIITTSFHTARTRRIFRKLAQAYPVILVAAAEYNVYDPNAWWSNRESRKLWLDEWVKTVYTWFELAKAPPENGKAEYQGLYPDIWSSRASGESGPLPGSDTADSPAGSADSGLQLPQPPAGMDSGKDEASDAVPKGEVKPGSPDSSGLKPEKAESKAELKADSLKARKDSVRSAMPRLPVEPKSVADPKPVPKETKKPSASAKGSSKSAEKKSEKQKSRR
jgi:uncharacterized SAM-binding protein YcdF (DUF218 family)